MFISNRNELLARDSYPVLQPTIHLYSPDLALSIKTAKVARIYGEIAKESFDRFNKDIQRTSQLKGDRVVLINSNGGMINLGQEIISALNNERASGTKIVCFVEKDAHSMAFNILTTCDVRLMSPKGWSLVHKTAQASMPSRVTAKVLRDLANQIDKDDEPFRVANAAAMRLSLQQYDTYADNETYWRADTLLSMAYLHGLATVK